MFPKLRHTVTSLCPSRQNKELYVPVENTTNCSGYLLNCIYLTTSAPAILPLLWRMVRPLISEEMKNKVCILGGNVVYNTNIIFTTDHCRTKTCYTVVDSTSIGC